MAFFIIHVFPTVMGGTTHFFTQKRFSKEVLKRLKKFEILLLIQIIIRKIQGVNMLVISNRPRAMHSTNFEITYLIQGSKLTFSFGSQLATNGKIFGRQIVNFGRQLILYITYTRTRFYTLLCM